MTKKKVVSVYIRGSEQWSFEPMEEGENYFITPRFARMPPIDVGVELKVGKKQIGIVTSHGSYKGSSMRIHYEPAPAEPARRSKQKKVRAQVEVKTEKVEDGTGSSGVGSS